MDGASKIEENRGPSIRPAAPIPGWARVVQKYFADHHDHEADTAGNGTEIRAVLEYFMVNRSVNSVIYITVFFIHPR
jgi:hypothetical protein